MQIDHLVYGTQDLEAAVEDVASLLGIRPVPGGQHVGLGTRNYLVGLGGSTYLEIIGPDPDQLDPISPRPFGIDHLEEDRLVAWAVVAADIEVALHDLRHRGVDLGKPKSMDRKLPGGGTLRWRLTSPVPGVVPFVIEWRDGQHPTESLTSELVLHGLRLESPDADEIRSTLEAFEVDVDVRGGFEDRLAATIDTPSGRVVLW